MMFGCTELKKCKKQLAEMKSKEEKADNKLEKLENQYGSKEWAGYDTGNVARLSDRYKNCAESDEKDKIVATCEELDSLSSTIDSFIENEYALEVFKVYSKKKPKLVRISTDEVYSWDDAFGTSFDKIEKGLRHSLVGLVEEPTRYRFK